MIQTHFLLIHLFPHTAFLRWLIHQWTAYQYCSWLTVRWLILLPVWCLMTDHPLIRWLMIQYPVCQQTDCWLVYVLVCRFHSAEEEDLVDCMIDSRAQYLYINPVWVNSQALSLTLSSKFTFLLQSTQGNSELVHHRSAALLTALYPWERRCHVDPQ